MGCIGESVALCSINLNKEFRNDGKLQYSQQTLLWIETVLVILRDIETERELLRVQQGKGATFEKLLDLMNRAEYFLQELETGIQKPL